MGKNATGERLTTIWVKYRNVEGYHVFTSDDVRGLYVASKDGKKAYDEVAPILSALIKQKTGTACEILPSQTFDEFTRLCRPETAPATAPTVMGDRTYIVRCAA